MEPNGRMQYTTGLKDYKWYEWKDKAYNIGSISTIKGLTRQLLIFLDGPLVFSTADNSTGIGDAQIHVSREENNALCGGIHINKQHVKMAPVGLAYPNDIDTGDQRTCQFEAEIPIAQKPETLA